MKFVAIIGFGRRATKVSVDPEALFQAGNSKKFLLPFKDLLKVKTEDDLKNLKKENSSDIHLLPKF